MTASSNNGKPAFPADARAAAALYLQKGLAPVPLWPRTDVPSIDGWQDLRVTIGSLDMYFPPGAVRNISVLNGAPSNNHHDVDIDCPEGLLAAPHLLPKTGWIFGRESTRRAHWIYRTERAFEKASEKYKDLDGEVLVELRGNRGQTNYPPSVHGETGEVVSWDLFDEPGEARLAELLQAVAEVAAVALLARHWPKVGSRHDAFLALSGALLRDQFPTDRVLRLVEALVAATEDEQRQDRIATVMGSAKTLSDGDPATGWTRITEVLGDNGERIIQLVKEWLNLRPSFEVAEPPIPEPPPWPEEPGAEAYYGLAGMFVETISPVTEADPIALLTQLLASFGNALGRTAQFRVEGDHHYSNEYFVLVGKTAKARKGTSWGRVRNGFIAADPEWAEQRVQTGLSSGEGLIWAVRDPITKRECVRERGEPPRYEEVVEDPGIIDKRLLIYEPEFANVLKQTERQGNTLSAVLRQAWDGCDLRTMTKKSPACATGPHISLVGHITEEELRRYLTRTESANGFGNRFIFICTKRSKILPEGRDLDLRNWQSCCRQLREALEFARAVGEVKRDEEAREIWHEVYEELSEGRRGLAGALQARGEAHVMRLAMIYAVMDKSSVICHTHLMAALALWDFAERSVIHIFGDGLGDPVADEIVRLLRHCPGGLTRSDIYNFFGRHQSSERIGSALGLLMQERLVRREEQRTGGRSAERWFAVPRGR